MNFNDWSEEITKNLKQADDVVKQILGMVRDDNRFTPDSDALKSVVESMVETQLKSFGIPSKRAHEALQAQLQEAQHENEMLWKRIKILEDKLAEQSGVPATSEPEAFKPAAQKISKTASVKTVAKSSSAAKPISKSSGGVKRTTVKQTSAKESITSVKSKPNNLTKIRGIGPKLQAKLAAAGINTYEQLATLTVNEAQALDNQLGLQGRVLRDDWTGQARTLYRD